jgi:bla regulator protein blaR1
MMNGWLSGIGPAVGNHLWQSTAFAAVAWGVTLLLRKNQARIRYGIWLAASVKFLLPFSLLIGLGGMLPRPQRPVVTMPVYSAVDEVGLPFSEVESVAVAAAVDPTHAARMPRHGWGTLLLASWSCGVVVVLAVWSMRCRQVVRTLRRARRVEYGREVELLRRVADVAGVRPVPLAMSREWMEPGMFGVWRPVLIWPEGLSARLEDEHIEAVMVHELAHAKRRDNLTATLHMIVEAAFWFHPLVWWMERRMVEERERACDEAVIALGGRPEVYAESLLKAVRFCVESPLVCVAGITGADLAARVRGIMTLRLERLGVLRKVGLAALGVAAILGPVAFGVVRMIPMYGQVIKATGPLPEFEAVTIKPAPPDERGMGFNLQGRHFRTINTSIADLLRYAYGVQSRQMEGLPAWAETEKYDITGVAAESGTEKPDWKLMVQKLLADRFGFRFHSSTKEMPVYELQVGKNGPKLTKSSSETQQGELYMGRSDSGPGKTVHGKATTMAGLAKSLESTEFDRPVVDRTGLTGKFDFEMTFLSDHVKGQPIGPPVEDEPNAPPGIFTAIQDQLGLKLVPSKGPTEIMVIDHVEKPVFDSAAMAPKPIPSPGVSKDGAPGVLLRVASEPEKRSQGEAAPSVADPCPGASGLFAAYDVVSVRPVHPERLRFVGLQEIPDGLTSETVSAAMMVQRAYSTGAGVPTDDAVDGLPDWGKGQYFSVQAKMNPDQTAAFAKLIKDQQRACRARMLQALLADRFKLQVHHETRQVPGYELTVAKGGPKMKEVTASDPIVFIGSGGRPLLRNNSMRIVPSNGAQEVVVENFSMDQLAEVLMGPGSVGHKVANKTGLTGLYSYTLTYALSQGVGAAPAGGSAGTAPDPAPTVFNALEDQLGLKLQRGIEAVDVVVVDHIERPSEN